LIRSGDGIAVLYLSSIEFRSPEIFGFRPLILLPVNPVTGALTSALQAD
jgi:hypothetical protein